MTSKLEEAKPRARATDALATLGSVAIRSVWGGNHAYDEGVVIESRRDECIEALDALRKAASQDDVRISSLHEEVDRAVAAGASWNQVAKAIGVEREDAWEQLRQDVSAAMRRNAARNADLSEAEAMELAVAETKAVRAERAQRRSRQSRRSGLSI